MNPKNRKRIVIRGEGGQLRVGAEMLSLEGGPLVVDGVTTTHPGPYAVVEIADEGQRLYITATKGAVAAEPDLWVLGMSPPIDGALPKWGLMWKSEPGDTSPEISIVITCNGTVRVL